MTKGVVLFLEPKGTIFEIVKSAHEQGYVAIALSSYLPFISTPPTAYIKSASLLEYSYKVQSWNNYEDIEAICKIIETKYGKVVGVYYGLDLCAVIAAKLRIKYGLPTTSPEVFKLVLDKYKLRAQLRNHKLSTLSHYSGEEVDKWEDWQLEKSMFFKPTHGAFSAYVTKCQNLQEVHLARKNWRQGDPSDPEYLKNYVNTGGSQGYHIEEAIDGELLSVEGILRSGHFHFLGLLSRIMFSKNPVVEMGSCFPYPHRLADKIIASVIEAHRVLGITDGPTHTEVIVGYDDRVEIIDLNPRFVGADVLQSINYALDIRLEDQLLNFALGKEITLPTGPKCYACLQYILPPAVSHFESITFPLSEDVKFTTQYISAGTEINSHERQVDYLGCYLTVMPTYEEAIHRSNELRKEIKVNQSLEGVY